MWYSQNVPKERQKVRQNSLTERKWKQGTVASAQGSPAGRPSFDGGMEEFMMNKAATMMTTVNNYEKTENTALSLGAQIRENVLAWAEKADCGNLENWSSEFHIY